MNRAARPLVLALLLTSAARALEPPTDPNLRAMHDEMQRSMQQLKLANAESPYFLAYRVEDLETYQIGATFGALTSSTHDRRRSADVDLRVGSYQVDNSGFFGMGLLEGLEGLATPLPLDDDYWEQRRALWLLTDRAYKQAIDMLSQKKAVLSRGTAPKEADFSEQPAVTVIEPRAAFKLDVPQEEGLVERLSAVMRNYPAIQSSRAQFTARVLHRYFVNSEGTVGLEPHPMAVLTAEASVQCADGMKLTDSVSFFGARASDLPGEAQMTAGVDRLARNLTALANAPKLASYTGPVLFAPAAAASTFAHTLVAQLSGERPPLFQDEGMSAMLAGENLGERLGRPVLPAFLSIKDDPLGTRFQTFPLLGGQRLDAQGVPARPLTLVDGGVLKTLFMSRRPRQGIPRSNGHAEASMLGLGGAGPTNLLILSNSGKKLADLKQELLARCRAEHLPFGILVRTMRGPSLAPDPMAVMAMMQGHGHSLPPGLVYRVWVKDGREELVRGAIIEGLTANAMKHLLASGTDYGVHHSTVSGAMSFMGMSAATGLEGSTLTTLVAPAVLFDELELKATPTGTQKPPLLTSPGFGRP